MKQWTKIKWITIHKEGIVYWRKPVKTTGVILAVHAFRQVDSLLMFHVADVWLFFRASEEIHLKLMEGWETGLPWKKARTLKSHSQASEI